MAQSRLNFREYEKVIDQFVDIIHKLENELRGKREHVEYISNIKGGQEPRWNGAHAQSFYHEAHVMSRKDYEALQALHAVVAELINIRLELDVWAAVAK
jgi:exonuclease VII small subunit